METHDRFLLIVLLIILSATIICAQITTKDVVYLKNGSIIKGSIIELIPEKTIKIQTSDGSIFVYATSEIERISKETVQSSETISIFGGGGQSLPSRFSIFGGTAIPVGDFASETSADGGWAKTGFTAGAQFVTGGQIGFLVHASYTMNPTKITENPFPYHATIESGSWSSILLLAGPKIGTTNPAGTNFFFAPVLGVNIGGTPKLTGKISDTYSQYIYSYPYSYYVGPFPITGEGTVPSESKAVFAYGATAEAMFSGNITIGARYIACKPKYDFKGDFSFSGSSGSGSVTGSGTFGGEREQSTSLIFIYIGMAF